MRHCRSLALALLLAGTGPALAEDLVALSNTAMAVTGDIFMDDFELRFADGQALAFDALVADRFEVDGQLVNASVYSVESPADPVLLNGNRLCGEGRVTYVAVWGGHAADMAIVAVFTTQDVPLSSADMCASYTYEYLY